MPESLDLLILVNLNKLALLQLAADRAYEAHRAFAPSSDAALFDLLCDCKHCAESIESI
jgi:hypothetical protein